jgi:glutathione S-transferase
LPAVRVDGETISDSENIIRFFESRGEPALDRSLTKTENSQRVLLSRLMNGSIYQLMVAERWLDPDVYPRFVESFRTMLPSSVRPLWPLVRPLLARRVRAKYTRSIAHLSSEERLVFARENFSALAQQLGDQPYLFGDLPTSADAYLFAYTYAFLAVPFDSPIRRLLESEYPNLVSFYSRTTPLAVGDLP